MNGQRLPTPVHDGLAAGATILCASAQRQASLRAAWAEQQRASGQALWQTPRVFTFTQFAERLLNESWAEAQLPDRLLPPAAEWAALREWRRDSGGAAEARALLQAVRTVGDWNIARSPAALAGSPEGELLLAGLARLDELGEPRQRKPLRAWLAEIPAPGDTLLACGTSGLSAASQEALRRWQARGVEPVAAHTPVAIACAEDDDHELDLI
ncbi:MAG TPA: hypothetical protein VN755_01725, partial [Steroidobacteraceae bacterium]|nr:hypothetical protein [Steroidobacteraceae bacterium]